DTGSAARSSRRQSASQPGGGCSSWRTKETTRPCAHMPQRAESRSARCSSGSRGSRVLAPELQLVPARHGRELEQRAAAARVAIAEVAAVLVPRDFEQPLLDTVVEPRSTEDELAQPVDERLAFNEGNALPVPNQVAAEPAPRFFDQPVGGELD